MAGALVGGVMPLVGAVCLGSVIGWWLHLVVSGSALVASVPLVAAAVAVSALEVAWLAGPSALIGLFAGVVVGATARGAWVRNGRRAGGQSSGEAVT